MLQTFTEIVNRACERGDVVPPASQDFHSRVKFFAFCRIVVEGVEYPMSLEPKMKKTQVADLVQRA